MRTIVKGIVLIFGVLVIFVLGIVVFMNVSPQFGALPEGKKLEVIKTSTNYSDSVFENLIPTSLDMSGSEILSVMKEYTFGENQREPTFSLPTAFSDNALATDSITSIVWYGHSAVLLHIDGKKVLFDPMLGAASSPVPFLTKRFRYDNPIPIDELKNVDFVVISHDHYDHLDLSTILKLKEEVGHFYTALGVGSHLESWGVAADKITELDWWQSDVKGDLTFISTPARHFSGRGMTDRNKTQWASWVIIGKDERIYFSGDGGYANHFEEIGERYGPFDFSMIECGQYNERWAQIHMLPEESTQAAIDLKTKVMMPIHWGAFNLSLHSWTDPIERVMNSADQRGVNLIHPVIGQRIAITERSSKSWWIVDSAQ